MKKQSETLNSKLLGRWKTTEQFGPLNYDSNFENWINAQAVHGHFEFEVRFDEQLNDFRAEVHIPVTYYLDFLPENIQFIPPDRLSTYARYSGRLQVRAKTFLIWENEKCPHRISYHLENRFLTLKLFGQKMVFVEENPRTGEKDM